MERVYKVLTGIAVIVVMFCTASSFGSNSNNSKVMDKRKHQTNEVSYSFTVYR